MKRLLLLLSLAILMQDATAQLNMELRSSVGYNESANDIWGYAANGREYALVGLQTGVSIIDVTDPDNPVELGEADGSATTWRDIKTYGTWAYVIAENDASDGLLVIDLSNLPNQLTTDDWYYLRPEGTGGGQINFCHNIYIDEFGYAYLTGCNLNQGAPIIYDVFTTPGTPIYVSETPPIYAHDVYAESNKLYTSDINVGEFTIYDVSDKSNIVRLGSQPTEAAFTHNVWISDDETIAFTTDERPNAPVGAYDVSDPSNIIELDQFRPLETLGDGVIPHNTHVWDDYLIISYYSDGCIIVDASEPDHLIEVGNFDTYIPQGQGFNGAWGAYPYLPSGTVLVSDIGSGLYVLTPTYKRAARLKGTVQDSLTGEPLNNVEVLISSTQTNFAFTDFQGKYKTGIADGGNYTVSFRKFGYETKSINMNLENGQILDIVTELKPIDLVSFSGIVRVESNGNPIPGAQIEFAKDDFEISTAAGSNGAFSLEEFEPGEYDVLVGAWGYKYKAAVATVEEGSALVFELVPGYEDNFGLDLGWDITGNAGTGSWERGEPVGTNFQGTTSNPDFDLTDDLSDKCYVTGNGGGGAGNDDVDDGTTTLTSPAMNLAGFSNPILNFSYWWFNAGGNSAPNDALSLLFIDNNGNTVDQITYDTPTQWQSVSINLKDYINTNGSIHIAFQTADGANSGHLVEAAIDGFSVINDGSNSFPDFTISDGVGCIPFSITLTDVSDSTASWNWAVTLNSGATTLTSTEQNPTIEITEAGTYNVILEAVTNSGNTYVVSQTNGVVASDVPTLNNFAFTPNNGEVSFMANATNATSWAWDFGDGNTSTLENPIHTYSEGDMYTVTLTATNACGSTDVTAEIFTDIMTSTSDIGSEQFIQHFPNPFENQIVVDYDLSSLENGSLRLINIHGQIVNQFYLSAAKGVMSIGGDLNTGVYFLQVIDSERAYTPSRIVKIMQ